MNDKKGKQLDRRDFFCSIIRNSALAVLGLAGGAAVYKRLNLSEECINRGICSGCRIFTDCGLPQALSAKKAKGIGK